MSDDPLHPIVRERFRYRRTEINRHYQVALQAVAERARAHDGDIDAKIEPWASMLDEVSRWERRLRAFDEAEAKAAELAIEERL